MQANKDWAVDATNEDSGLGRFANHSRFEPNIKARVVVVNGVSTVCFFALRGIQSGEELVWNYGEDNKSILASNPWLLEDTRSVLKAAVSVFSADL